jgi:aspartate/methionine/tyrosine aminotransferase
VFPRIDYVDWILPRIDAAVHDLGSSDLHPETDDARLVVPPRLADLPTPGADLETLIAEAYDVDPDEVLVTAGASAANLLAIATALRDPSGEDTDDDDGPGHVLVEKPGYEPLVATPRGFGATVDRYRREETWALDPDRIDAAAMDETRLIVASNRHNPSGARADRETLSEAASTAASADARLLVDEVYAPYGPEGEGVFGGPTAAGLPDTVVTSSLTKFWGFGSLRIGWLVADPEFVGRAREVSTHLHDVADPSRTLARRLLANRGSIRSAQRERCLRNHEALRSFVESRSDLSGAVFDGCPYAFLEHESADGDAVAAAAWEEDVLVVPGRFFGADDGVRVSLGGPPDRVEAALSAFEQALDRLA